MKRIITIAALLIASFAPLSAEAACGRGIGRRALGRVAYRVTHPFGGRLRR